MFTKHFLKTLILFAVIIFIGLLSVIVSNLSGGPAQEAFNTTPSSKSIAE